MLPPALHLTAGLMVIVSCPSHSPTHQEVHLLPLLSTNQSPTHTHIYLSTYLLNQPVLSGFSHPCVHQSIVQSKHILSTFCVIPTSPVLHTSIQTSHSLYRKRHVQCNGEFHGSMWLGRSTEIFGPTPVQMLQWRAFGVCFGKKKNSHLEK